MLVFFTLYVLFNFFYEVSHNKWFFYKIIGIALQGVARGDAEFAMLRKPLAGIADSVEAREEKK